MTVSVIKYFYTLERTVVNVAKSVQKRVWKDM